MAGQNENSIGTARAYLDIDATDWDAAIARAKNSAAGLGNAAEQAFDQATKAQKRAANQLLFNNQTLDEAKAKQLALNAVAKGAPVEVAQAWAKAVQSQIDATKQAAAEQAKLNAQLERQTLIDNERARQNAENAQRAFNQQYAPGLSSGALSAGDRAHLTNVFSSQMDAEDIAASEAATAAAKAEALAIDELAAKLVARDVAEGEAAAAAWAASKATQAETVAVEQLATAQTASTAASTKHATATAAQQAELGKLIGQIDPVTAKLNKLDDVQQKLIAAKNKGFISTDDFNAFNKVIEDNRVKVTGAADAMTKLNFNTAQARREYGYLIKDVATGQWGRFEQSAATLANNIGGLGVKFLAVAGTIAVVTAAFVNAEHEWDKFVTSVAEGDGLSGTVKQLDALTKAIAGQDGNTLSDARDAVESLAKSGLLSGQNFELAARAAADWASTTGESADKVASNFDKIAKGPMKAIEDGTVRVTEAQYEQIQALEESGKSQEAVNALVRIYFDEIENRSAMVKENLSGFTTLWHEIRDSVKGAKDGAVDYFDTLAAGIANLKNAPRSKDWGFLPIAAMFAASPQTTLTALGTAAKAPSGAPPIVWNTGALGENAAQPPGVLSPQQVAAQTQITKLFNDAGTAAEKYAKQVDLLNGELNKATTDFLAGKNITRNADGSYGGAGYQQLLTTIRKRTGLGGSDSKDMSQENAAIKADAAAQQAQIAATTAMIQNQFKTRQISVEDYYDELKKLAQDSTDVQIDALNKEIAVDKAHGASKAQILALEGQITKAREDGAKKQQELDTQETEAIQRRTDATKAYLDQQENLTTALKRNLDAQVARAGMGQQEYEISQKINEQLNAQADALARIAKEEARNPNGANYGEERNKVLAETAQRIDDITTAYQQMNAQQLDITNGMKSSWADFSRQSMNLSDNFKGVWTDALTALGEKASLTATGIGTSFQQTAKSIEATAIRTLTNAAVQKLFSLFASYLGGGGGGATGIGDALNGGGNYTGAGSLSTSWAGMFGGFNAKGGTYNSPDLQSHINSIVNGPTMFKFAKGGAFGIMGEAGHEAIMPLSKDSNGVLGVRAQGGAAANAPVFNLKIVGGGSDPEVKRSPNGTGGLDVEVLFKQVDQYIAGGIANNTSATSQALRQRTGK